MPNKQQVTYDADKMAFIQVGTPAYVFAIDHPDGDISAHSIVHTSPVISFDHKTGVFETMNSVYTPLHDPRLLLA